MTTHVMNLLLALKGAAARRPPDGCAESITFELCLDMPTGRRIVGRSAP